MYTLKQFKGNRLTRVQIKSKQMTLFLLYWS